MYKWFWNALGWFFVSILLPVLVVFGGLFSLPREVPDVTGEPLAYAVQTVRRSGFRTRVVYTHSADVPAGQVILHSQNGWKMLLGSRIVLFVSQGPKMEMMPDLRGIDSANAQERLEELSFKGTCEIVYDQTVPNGLVISQNVEAGSMAAQGTQVVLTVSRGPAPVEIPNVRELTVSEANKILQDLGFVCNVVYVAKGTENGEIVAQSPSAGTLYTPGFQVTVHVTSLPFAAPDFKNLTLTQVREIAKELGLELKINRMSSNSVAENVVLSQSPAAGRTVFRGDSVSVSVSTGPDLVTVPSLIGLSSEKAKEMLKYTGLKLNVRWDYTETEKSGKVIAQEPRAFSDVLPGAAVTVTCGIGYGHVRVPDLTGLTRAEAERVLLEAGLKLSYMQTGVSLEHPGEAVAQSPGAGDVVKKGTVVNGVFYKKTTKRQVPNISGMCRDCAAKELEKFGFGMEITYVSSSASQCGKVIHYYSQEGSNASEGSSVYVRIGYCGNEVLMPDVRGMTFEEAAKTVSLYGLTAEKSADYAPDYASGTVCRQRIEPGVPVKRGSVATLYLNLLTPEEAAG